MRGFHGLPHLGLSYKRPFSFFSPTIFENAIGKNALNDVVPTLGLVWRRKYSSFLKAEEEEHLQDAVLKKQGFANNI